MKKALSFLLLSSSVMHAHARPLVVYGEDGRKEVFEVSPQYQLLARSTPSMIPQNNILISIEAGKINLRQSSFQEWLSSRMGGSNGSAGLCSGERFTEQPNPAVCSGFLIAPDLVVTAGHCAQVPDMCENYKWVFDFKVDPVNGTAGVEVLPENIYSCKKIITKSLDSGISSDFGIVQLDRKVLDRSPLDVRLNGKIEDEAEVLVIGNPSGLPLKVTEGGKVRKNEHSMYFVTNLDTFQGNSGSAVINLKTNVVEGILVRGETDFVSDEQNNCIKTNFCNEDGCRGEDVSRIGSIPEIALKEVLDQAAESGNIATLKQILSYNTWVDFYGKDGQSPLIKATLAGKNDSIITLLAHGADVNLSDRNGDTALHHLARNLSLETQDMLETLLTAKADLEARNLEGKTPLMLAQELGNEFVIKTITEALATKN
jgi:V8-like Glu-specific endopeptidase